MHKFRELAMIGVGKAIELAIARHTSDDHNGICPSCISCKHFDEKGEKGFGPEICLPANQRPPARIIAFGCNTYADKDNIPF